MTARPRKAVAAVQAPDFGALLANAKLPEEIVKVCLRADLAAEHEQLDEQLAKLLDNPPAKLGGDGRGELRQRIEALEAEMTAATYPFRLRGLSRRAWEKFKIAYPPRTEPDGSFNRGDLLLGANGETVWEPLIRRCIVDPVLSDAQWEDLLEKITDKQFDDLAGAAWKLCRRDVDVPFSHAVSRLSQPSDGE